MPDAAKLAAVRELLPATAAGIYLNAGTAGPLPSETARAMDEVTARDLAVGRAHVDVFADTVERMGEARAAVAAVLVAGTGDIALTHSTTDGMNLAVAALSWRAGDRVVTTRHEHPGGLGPLLVLRDRIGVEIVQVDVDEDGDDERTVAAFEAALDDRTRAVVFSHVLWTTGAVMPVARIAAAARAAGCRVIVDAAQSAGAIPVSVEALGVDAYALPAQKWLLGPDGMGALWVDRSFADACVPPAAGWLSFETFGVDSGARFHPGAARFEATNFHRPSIVGFARSCGWLSMYVGLSWAQDRAVGLAAAAADRLGAIPGVRVLTPRSRMGTLVTFRIEGWSAEAAGEELGTRVFAITRSIAALDALRISVGFWTTEAELDRFAEAVELLARHSPATIPARRRLTVLGSDDAPLG
jgi:L-cysteine/cystine lyase